MINLWNKNSRYFNSKICVECQCQWYIIFKLIQKDKPEIQIRGVSLDHTNGCEPNSNQLFRSKMVAGDYAKSLEEVYRRLVIHLTMMMFLIID